MSKQSKVRDDAGDAALAEGLVQNAARVGAMTVAGTTMTPAAIAQVLTGRIAARKAATAAGAALRAAVAAERETTASTRAVVRQVRVLLRCMFSHDAAQLATFGLSLKTPAPSLATKAKAAAAAKATRAAGGKKAKARTGDAPPG